MVDMCRPPNPHPASPGFRAPVGTTDCHLHIFGPVECYPYRPERSYTPPDATCVSYLHLAKTVGIERVVIVQASVYGFWNERLLDALTEIGLPARGVVVIPAETDDVELDRLHALGVRGVRVIATQPGGLAADRLDKLGRRLDARGWHLQLMLSPEQLLRLEPQIAQLACPFVLDHFAFIPAADGIGQPAFRAMMRLMATGRGWAKLSAAYHCSRLAPPYPDLAPFASELIATAPDRLVWGTDWPHVHFDGEMPNTTALFDRLQDWIPDETLRRRILVDNPAELYCF